MLYKAKYKLVKEYISKYLKEEDIAISVDNANTEVVIETDDGINYSVYFNKSDGVVSFAGDENLANELELLSVKHQVAEIVKYLGVNNEIRVRDNNFCVYIKKIFEFKTDAVMIGNKDHIICVVVDNPWTDYDSEDIVLGLTQFEHDRGFPELKNLVVEIPMSIYYELPVSVASCKYIGLV